METNKLAQFNLFAGGRKLFERTNEYKNKADEIVEELRNKYSPELSNEKSWARRLLLKLKFRMEVRKRINALSSLKNRHAIGH
jgi:hypothetical protein